MLARPLQRARESFNFRARRRLRHADQRVLCEFRIRRTESEGPNDFFMQELRVHQFYGTRQVDYELIKKWCIERALHAGNF